MIKPALRPVQQQASSLPGSGTGWAAAGAGPDNAPPVQPTIRVTIGRIEVRATAAPAPPPRKPATVPAMSLEEYLKMRNGGRR